MHPENDERNHSSQAKCLTNTYAHNNPSSCLDSDMEDEGPEPPDSPFKDGSRGLLTGAHEGLHTPYTSNSPDHGPPEVYDSYNQDWQTSERTSPSNLSSHSLPCVSLMENYYSAEVNASSEGSGRVDGKHGNGLAQRKRKSRSDFRRQLSIPASGLRARSLSRGGDNRFRLHVPLQGASHSSTLPPEDVAENEAEEPEEEWKYKPLSFWSLPRSDKLVLIALGLVDLTLYMCLSVLAPFFPQEALNRGVSNTVSGWIFGVFALVQFITSPLFGYLCPRIGSRFLFISGHFIAGGCTILFGVLDQIPQDNSMMFVAFCFLVRVMLALGCTASATASFAIMANTFPDNVATLFGILEMFTGVGLMVGPAVGGVLYQAGGFMLPFVCLGGVMLLSIPFLYCILKPQGDEGNEPIEPSSIRHILCIPAVVLVLLASIIGSLIWAILDPTLEPHLRYYNLSSSVVGLIFLLMAFFYAIASPFWGWIADKVVDSTPLMIMGFLTSAFGLLLLGPSSLLGFPAGFRALWLDLLALCSLGVTCSLALVPTFEKVLDSVEKAGIDDNYALYGAVAGLWGGAYALGEFIGPSVGGFIMDKFGFEWCMTFAAVPCFVVSLLLFVLWMYERYVKPTPCLMKIPAHIAIASKPERTPLLDDNECATLPPPSSGRRSSSGSCDTNVLTSSGTSGPCHNYGSLSRTC